MCYKYIYIYRYEYMRIDRRKRLQVLSVSDASSGMLNACKQHCILCTVSSLCSAREGRKECEETMRTRKDWVVWSRARPAKGDCTIEKEGKLIQEMSESRSLRES